MGCLVLAPTLTVVLAATTVACGDGGTDDATGASPITTPSETASATGAGADEGARVYADNCSGCHGADGSGGSGPALTGEDDLDEVRARIENGGGPMPAFSGQMPPGQIDALAQYVVGGLQ